MIKSMTGFGRVEFAAGSRKMVLEIKSLNSKQLDVNLRLPQPYRSLEAEIRPVISGRLVRGKVDVVLAIEDTGSGTVFQINEKLAAQYHEQISKLADSLKITLPADMMGLLLQMPEVVNNQEDALNDEDKGAILNALDLTIDSVDAFRISEGKVLEADLMERLNTIVVLKDEIRVFERTRKERIREKLLVELGGIEGSIVIDKNRLEQEIIYYVEKLDINEEVVRLGKHCEYFAEVMSEEVSQGKKLGFIAQEIGREINTIGSKANDYDIQHIVVQMKDELEKIREQLFNIL